MDENRTLRTDDRVEIVSGPDEYVIAVGDKEPLTGGLLNIGGRAAAFPEGAILELGGGTSEVIIKAREDSRSSDGVLLAVGFSAEAILDG